MISFECFERARCAREEKTGTASLIKLWVALSEKARREGILSLEEMRNELTGTLPAWLLGLAIDGLNREDLRTVGEAAIASSGLSGRELLDALIDLEACISIKANDSPHTLALKLAPYLGSDSDLLSNEDLFMMEGEKQPGLPSAAEERKIDCDSIVADVRAKLKLGEGQIEALRDLAHSGNAFEGMSPDDLAIILLYMDGPARKTLLESLSCERQAEAMRSICDLGDMNLDFYIEAARASLERLIAGMEKNYKPAGGIAAAVTVLKSTSGKNAKAVLINLAKENPALSESIRTRMFTFEDIIRLDDRSIQKVLGKADSQRLALALKGASPSCSERIFSNLSHNAAIMLREDMEYMGPARIGDVKAAREEMLSIVRALEEGGEIIINSEEPDEGLIQ